MYIKLEYLKTNLKLFFVTFKYDLSLDYFDSYNWACVLCAPVSDTIDKTLHQVGGWTKYQVIITNKSLDKKWLFWKCQDSDLNQVNPDNISNNRFLINC